MAMTTTSRRRGARAALIWLGLLAALPAAAQDSPNATTRLIQILIAKGILTPDQAASVLSQAQSEGRAARATRGRGATGAGAAAGALATAEPPPPPPGTVRVPYVPATVRDQIAAQVRDEVLGTARAENWAAPNALPEWTKRVTVYGDVRARYERDFFDRNNDRSQIDFNAINNGSPFDTNQSSSAFVNPPLLNTTEDRNRFRLRARIGVKADIDDWISSDIRIATGSDNSPVSTNQTLGGGTNFGKYALWLDRAYIDVHAPAGTLKPDQSVKAWFGRSPNPFWTTDLVFDDDLNFDGFSIQGVTPVRQGVKAWLTAGAFPVFNSDFNFSTLAQDKTPSRDKYLFAAQLGTDLRANDDWSGKAAVGFFDYSNIEGKTSAPCTVLLSSDACNTDLSRTQFKQFGNTVYPIRNLVQVLDSSGNLGAQPQYFGLASRFDVLDLHAAVSYARYLPYLITLEGEYAKNLAFNKSRIENRAPVNNVGDSNTSGNTAFNGGDTAYMVKLEVGPLEIRERNQWNAYVEYKHLESDSVLDAFTDSDFHQGGTNAKGFVVGANYGVAHNTFLAFRWLSAKQIDGPRYQNDVLQLDLNAKF